VNGDSHSAGAEIYTDFCCNNDDQDFHCLIQYMPNKKHLINTLGTAAHYGNLWGSYGGFLSRKLNKELVCDAVSGSSNARIYRTTMEYISKNKNDFILIGWSTWERKELIIDETDGIVQRVQITASGTDSVPSRFQDIYKKWIADMDKEYLIKCEKENHRVIYELHKYLQEQNIKHYFFNTFSYFGNIPENDQYDWDDCYFHPYEQAYTFYHYLKNRNHEPNKNYHHCSNAHYEWAELLFDKLRKQCYNNE